MKTPRIPPSVRILLAATATAVPNIGTRIHAEEPPATSKGFTNSLGMRMVPVKATPGLLWCVWETRNSDFEAYLADRGPGRRKPWFDQGPDHPAVNLSRDDAMGFCDWLTIRDIDAGLISPQSRYTLPGDLEWSAAAGLGQENGSTPAERNLKVAEQWIWGSSPFPPDDFGNIPDESLQRKFGTALPGLKAYDDGHACTAPVGSYPPDANGLFDLGGNVSEWVVDQGTLVARGASWEPEFFKPWTESLLPSYRRFMPAGMEQSASIGFRIVLEVRETVKDGAADHPLRKAARNGDLKALRAALARAGISKSSETPRGEALLLAANLGFPEAVGLLLEAKADPDFGDGSQLSPLVSALIAAGYSDGRAARAEAIVRSLLAAKADPRKACMGVITPLKVAVGFAPASTVKLLLEAGALPDAPAERAALLAAVGGRAPRLARDAGAIFDLLVAAGADPKALDPQVGNAFHKAASLPSLASLPIWEALLARGVDPNARNSRGETPVERLVAGAGKSDDAIALFHWLLDHGALLPAGKAGADGKGGWQIPGETIVSLLFSGREKFLGDLIDRGARLPAPGDPDFNPGLTGTILVFGDERTFAWALQAHGKRQVPSRWSDDPAYLTAAGLWRVRNFEALAAAGIAPADAADAGVLLDRALSGFSKTDEESADGAGAYRQAIGSLVLRQLASGDREAMVKWLIKAGADVRLKSGDLQETPLHAAARGGFTDEARALLEAGAEIDALDGEGFSPFHNACEKGRVEVAKLLLERGAKWDTVVVQKPMSDRSPLSSAAQTSAEILKLLLERGAVDHKGEVLLNAAAAGNLESVRLLLAASPGADWPSRFPSPDANPLWVTVRLACLRHSDQAIALRRANAKRLGANPGDDIRPASIANYAGIIGELVKAGFPVDAGIEVKSETGKIVRRGWTPLMQLCDPASRVSEPSFAQLARKLVELGADPNKKTAEGVTPLVLASFGRSAALIRVLTECGADPDTVSLAPWLGADLTLTPLHGAVSSGSTEMVQALLQAKADPNVFDGFGFTPLMTAAALSQGIQNKSYQGSGTAAEKVRLLLGHGAKPSLGAKGQMPRFTALHAAASAGDLEVIRLLAGKGADLSATCGESIASPGISGKTPRELAEMNNQWAAAKLLRDLDRADR